MVGFILLTLSFGKGSGAVGGPLGSVFGPLENGASRVLKPVRDLANWFDETMAARGDREQLSAELEQARAEAVAGKEAIQENAQLRKLVNLEKRGRIPDAYSPVTGSVITRSPTVWFSTVGINRGSADGISVNDPVVNGDGLVGRISSVSRGQSEVTLITDSSSAVTAKAVPSGSQGVVRPKVGDPDRLVLEFLDQTRKLGKGQSVVTSGWRGDGISSFFPAGIPIGEVYRAPIDEREAIQSVELVPYPDFRNLDLLQVLTGGNRG
ncbi:MAG: rod shape-determining protein MreC [Thermoleophilia bacterium]|nr:rod shape-determining protein MreC [Thermoleophilia bacterium]